MNTMQGKSWGGIAAGLLAGAVVFLPVGFASAANRWGADYFPNVPLTTQDGATVRLYDDLLKGKSVAINVIYTSCKDECPLETARLVQLQRLLGERMGKDIFFYSITIDPKRDKPEVLKAYAEKYGVGPGWLFLTGKEEDIKLATKKLGLSRVRDSVSKDGHSASLMVGNEPSGLWMRNSAVDNPQFLATTIGNFLGWKDTTPRKSYAEARPLVLDKGEYFFQSQCSVCHTIGQGDKMDRAWLTRYITAPDKMLAEGDPIAVALFEKYQYARMPNLRLSSDEVAAVLSYVDARGGAPREPVRKDSVTGR
ncbi:MAG: electron transporter SenC [Betaproteobacteria bacterium]|nr:MAG: electron transporter SenC [Betaproteobacteria bacterium]